MDQTGSADNHRRRFTRSQYFIKKDFQTRFIIKFCLVVLAGVMVSTALLLFLSQDTLTSTYANSRLEIKTTGQATMPALLMTNAITLCMISLFAVAVLVFVSHKIAGPLFRFEKDLARVADGDLLVHVNLRKKDQLTDMSAALNRMIRSMHEKVSHIDSRLAKIEGMDQGDDNLRQEVKRLRMDLRNQFRLDN